MAEFLTTHGTIARIEQIISKAQERIVLVSPFLRWSDNLYERLVEADQRGVPIVFVYGKEELLPKERKKLDKLQHLSLYFCTRLHAKCYFNEQQMVISSLNLYESSEKNREMGVAVARHESVYKDAVAEAQSILAASELKSGTATTLVESPKVPRRAASPALSERGTPSNSPARTRADGHCIRCGNGIALDPDKPLCSQCYEIWAFFGNPDYEEKLCHKCGESSPTSMRRPLCKGCFRGGF